MQGPKDAPAKALVWTQARKPDRDGHEHYQAKTAAGCYSVAAEYQPGKGFIGYRVTQSVADKRRVIARSITVDEGKALAQRDYEQGDADERPCPALRPMPMRVPVGAQSKPRAAFFHQVARRWIGRGATGRHCDHGVFDQARPRHQPQDREGARPRNSR